MVDSELTQDASQEQLLRTAGMRYLIKLYHLPLF